ncbi:hypothetical protein V1512DRAFT_211677 [Lipomyces arxii]|uniref:uncharacterized protein n=1 Tax=Lipomyces arxii TaxID=56418 RepID=UPI0034CFCE56
MRLVTKLLSVMGIEAASRFYYMLRGYSGMSYLDPEIDIALVTGGCSGLGANIVKQLRAQNVPVVVLDILDPAEQVEGVYYLKCDISNRQQVLDALEVIKLEVGNVTVLINNAAVTHGKTIIGLEYEEIEKCIAINLLSQFYTIKAFLPGMLQIGRGYIVIISSVMAYIGPVKLSAYAASKAGLLGLYESLTYELGPNAEYESGVRTVLVTTGQMSTMLFEGVNTPHRLAARILETSEVADRVMLALNRGEQGRITLPVYAKLMPIVRVLPRTLVSAFRFISGIDHGMDTFLGDRQHVASIAHPVVSSSNGHASSSLNGNGTGSKLNGNGKAVLIQE